MTKEESIIPVKPSEISNLIGITNSGLSQAIKKKLNEEDVYRTNTNRVIGLKGTGLQKLIKNQLNEFYYKSNLIIVMSNCGGISKTFTSTSLLTVASRLSSSKIKLFIDTDSQNSGSQFWFGEAVDDNEPVLVDYFESRAKIEDIITPIPGIENGFAIKSSLNNLFLEKSLQDPASIKNSADRLFKDIFLYFKTKDIFIVIDTPPQISSLASSILVNCQKHFQKNILLSPIRSSDRFSVAGSRFAITNANEILEVFGIKDEIEKVVFLSAFDQRKGSTSLDTLKSVAIDPVLSKFLIPNMIRVSTAVSKSINTQENLFSSNRSLKTIGQDFMSLFFSLYK